MECGTTSAAFARKARGEEPRGLPPRWAIVACMHVARACTASTWLEHAQHPSGTSMHSAHVARACTALTWHEHSHLLRRLDLIDGLPPRRAACTAGRIVFIRLGGCLRRVSIEPRPVDARLGASRVLRHLQEEALR